MKTLNAILSTKIVAVVRLEDYTHAVAVAQALRDGGVTVLEFTLTGRGAIDAVRAVRNTLGDSIHVGIGTALTRKETEAAIDAGAQFVVTPALRRDVIALCVKRDIPIASGGLTPTELLEAHEAGAELVKLFPASVGGPKYIKDVLAPLPFLKIVPTGGVSLENAKQFLAAGAVAVGVGGNLVSPQAVASGSFSEITTNAAAYVRAIS